MLYLIILIYTIFLVYKYDYRGSKTGIKKHYNILLLLSIFIGGLSYRLGIDTVRYEESFNFLNLNMRYNYEDFLRSGNEPIWFFLNKNIKLLGFGFWGVKFIVLGFVNSTIFWFVRKYSPAFFFSIFLYFIYFYFAFNFQILREAMAVAFTLIGLDGILSNKKRGYLLYFLWIIPACMCHHFAFLSIIIPLVCFLRNGKWFVIVLILIVLTLPYWEILLSNLNILDDNLSERTEEYLLDEKQGFKSGISFILLLKNLIMGVLSIYLCTFYCKFKGRRKYFIGLTITYVLVGVLSLTSLGIMYRLRNYYAIPVVIAMGEAFWQAVVKKDLYWLQLPFLRNRLLVFLLFSLLVIAPIYNLFKSPLWPMYIPYSSIIFEEKDFTREKLYLQM